MAQPRTSGPHRTRKAASSAQRIFLSYRRSDSIEETNKLDEALSREFPDLEVFLDRRAIDGGEDFERKIDETLQACVLVVVVIGRGWAGRLPDGSLRINDERDFVRREVQLALQCLQNRRLHVLPLLVGDAIIPSADELPEALHPLVRINALRLRPGGDQAGDLRTLLERVRTLIEDPKQPPRRRFLPRTFDREDDNFRALEGSFQAAHQTLQALMAACSTQARALRHQAESILATMGHWSGEHPGMALLAHDPARALTHLDQAMDSEIGVCGAVGNLTGAGDLLALQGADRQELDMALRLGDAFHATAQALRPVATVGWVYYTSKLRFIHIHPWTHSKAVGWHARLLGMDFYALGVPRVNPGRSVFWTAPYEDHYGKGMMVTVAAPVYRGRRFLGTVAIDLGTDLLNDFVSSHRLARGPVFVVNAAGDLIAAPGIARSRDSGKRPVSDALPTELAGLPVQDLLREPGSWLVGRHLVMVGALPNTDWKLVHVCERSALS